MQSTSRTPESSQADTGTSILGAIVRTLPASLARVGARLRDLPGVEVALNPGDGRLVVLLEDEAGRSAERTLAEISQWSEVLSATLVYEHTEPVVPPALPPAPPGAAPISKTSL